MWGGSAVRHAARMSSRSRSVLGRRSLAAFQHHRRDHDGAGDRVLSAFDARHVNGRVPVEHRLDLFRMDLQAADIDDAAPPPHEIIAVIPQLDHVSGFDEALGVDERHRSADPT